MAEYDAPWLDKLTSTAPGSDVVNGIIGGTKKTATYDDTADKAGALAGINQQQNAWQTINPPAFTPVTAQQASQQTAQSQGVGPSAYNGIETNPQNMAMQQAQAAALANLAKNGGRNAASDANLAQIQQQENANEAGQRGALQQSFAARGMGGSGADMLAQLTAQQGSISRQNAQDLGVAGQEANTALQAGQGAANIGAGLEQQQYGEAAQKAAAQDRINQFNSGVYNQNQQFNAGQGNNIGEFNAGQRATTGALNNYQMPQAEYQDEATRAQGLSGADKAQTDFYGTAANQGNAARGNVLGSVFGAGAKVAGAAAAAAGGGQVPGRASVAGDSYSNDKVPVITSPGEVIVPRSLALHGAPNEVANFVKNPPAVKQLPAASRDKEAMLSALKNLKNRR